jgi:regulator of PEP synthase PpsR (kinase-PPPase family)
MGHKHQISLILDSTGETLNRIFIAIKSQFSNFDYIKKEHVFTRTKNQIDKIIEENKEKKNSIILYTIVETKLAKYITQQCERNKIPCFYVLGNLILNFSKILNQKATHTPSAQYVLNNEYNKRIKAIEFSITHDDGTRIEDVLEADIVLLGVRRTSKIPTSICLGNREYKILNIPLVENQDIPAILKEKPKSFCIVGLSVEANHLSDIRTNRLEAMRESKILNYSDLAFVQKEIESSKKLFKKYGWPSIDVTRKSV